MGFAQPDPLAEVMRWDAAAERIETPCGEGAMIWRAWGRGRPVVLLHGGAGSWRHWIRTIPVLATRYRVLAPDLPGLGESAMPCAPWSPWVSADIVIAGLRTLSSPDEHCVVVGFSAGAMIGGLVAQSLGAGCALLVLVGAGSLGTARRQTRLAKVRGEEGAALREAHRHNLATLMIADPSKIDEQALAIQAWNSEHTRVSSVELADKAVLREALAATTMPVKAIWGALDAVARDTLDERHAILRDLRPGVEIAIIPEAGHWVAYEAAHLFNATLAAMLGCEANLSAGEAS